MECRGMHTVSIAPTALQAADSVRRSPSDCCIHACVMAAQASERFCGCSYDGDN
jgi:hypothetical protein